MALEYFKILQILPDIFLKEIYLKESLILKISKKKTSMIMSCLKDCKLISDKICLKIDKELSDFKDIKGKYDKSYFFHSDIVISDYKLFDISFLKRVKSIDEENYILINFVEVFYI